MSGVESTEPGVRALHHLGGFGGSPAAQPRGDREAHSPNGWCILRMAGPRTLLVEEALLDAGVDAWTPRQLLSKRGPRRQGIRDVTVPMLATFAFAPWDSLPYLLDCLAMPNNPHPPFSVLRFNGKFPRITDAALAKLREAELDAKLALSASKHPKFISGSQVAVKDGAWFGMSGIVETIEGKYALVDMGGRYLAKIDTFLLESDVLQNARPA